MTWFLPHHFERKHPHLKRRAAMIKAMREFFDERGFMAVDTPMFQACPTFDTHIHGFKVEETPHYLRSSPEFDMKKLLVAGAGDMYQIGANFRRGEHSRLHRPEFTMVEWYRVDADYTAMMDDCESLLRAVSDTYTYKGNTCDPHGQWQKMSVCDAFKHYAAIDLSETLSDRDLFAKRAQEAGIRVIESDQWDDVFHAVMAEKIEPYLGMGTPCLLYDYPISMAALSRPKPNDPRFAERFELYVCGVELANAFSELTDADVQRARFAGDMAQKQALYGKAYPPDHDFFAALDHGLPPCAGIALGVDRLVMLACGANDIGDVMWVG